MTYSVVTLFDHPDEANEAMKVLERAGFDGDNIHSIESDPESQNFFKRVFSSEGGEELEADMAHTFLTGTGIPDDEADDYAKQVKKGCSLVLVENQSEDQAHRARQVLKERAVTEDEDERRRRQPTDDADISPRQRPEGRPGQGYAEPDVPEGRDAIEDDDLDVDEPALGTMTEDFDEGQQPVEPLESDPSSSPATGSMGETTSRDVGTEDMTAYTTTRFEQFEPQLRTHYEDTYAGTDYAFDDYARGYRYGMALAEDDEYRGQSWKEVEDDAARQWKNRERGPWDHFKEAVRYGWHRIRGDEDDSRPRPPGS